MSRVVALCACLLILSACDFGGPDSVRLPERAITVDVPPFVTIDRTTEFAATFTNTTERTVYIPPSLRPGVVREPGETPPLGPGSGEIIVGAPNPARAVAPGETIGLTLRVGLHADTWEDVLTADGRAFDGLYRVALPVGVDADLDQSSIFDIDPADYTVSAPFRLLFRWPDGRVFGEG